MRSTMMTQHFLALLLTLVISNIAHGATTEAPNPSATPSNVETNTMHMGHTMQHTMDHGTHQPGMHHTGTHQPGMHHTGTHQPGMHHTGTHHPGMHHTGMDHTGTHHHGMDHTGTHHHSGGDHAGTHHPGMHHTGTHSMDHSSMDHSGMDHGSGHSSYFYFGHHEVVVLFLEWTINTVPALIGSCIGVFAIAMLYEGLKVWREMLIVREQDSKKAASNSYSMTNIANGKSTSTLDVDIAPRATTPRTRDQICNCMHALQSLLHIVQVLVSYGLMLVFMTFNVWLCLSVAFGAGAGYFAFGWRRPITVDRNEHCH